MNVSGRSFPVVDRDAPLDAITRRAGANLGPGGVAAHYGSPAGELAVCVRGVGLVDRADLAKLVVTGCEDAVGALVARLAGSPLSPGGWTLTDGVYWCAKSAERVIVLGDSRDPLLEALLRPRTDGVTVTDRSQDWSVLGLVGSAAGSVLASLGILRNPRLATPFGSAEIGGVGVQVLLQSDRRAVVVVDTREAESVWRAIEAAGREFGLSYVGADAERRYAVLERIAGRA
jgi:glycine cleavage system aminomethyltransferase T